LLSHASTHASREPTPAEAASMLDLALELPVAPAYVGLTLAVPVFLTALIAVAYGMLYVLGVALGFSLDDRVGVTLTLAPLVAGLVWCLQRALAWLAARLPLGPIVSLDRLAAQGADAPDVGAKARHLALLQSNGARVAPGWVIRASVFDEASEIGAPDGPSVPRAALRSLHATLEASGEPRFLVRSSFGGEDGVSRAAPGIHASIVWERVAGAEGLATAITRVWASYGSDVAVQYRADETPGCPRLAILVQPLLDHDRAGVAASADLVGGGRGRHLVDVQRSSAPWRGVHDELTDAVTPLAGADPRHALPDEIVRQLSRLAARAEQALGCPAEIEWGLQGDRVTLYQARPITGAAPAATVTNSHLVELPTYPLSPLSHALLWGDQPPLLLLSRALERLGLGPLPDSAVRAVRGRVMLDVTPFKPLLLGLDDRLALGAWAVSGALFGLSGRGVAEPPIRPELVATGRSAGDLAASLSTIREARLLPLLNRQMRAVIVGAALDAWLVNRCGGDAPPLRVSRPDAGDGWWRAEREAELASPRRHEGDVDGAGEGPAIPAAAGPDALPWWWFRVRWLAWARDRQFTEREALNAEINAVNCEARQGALGMDSYLAGTVSGWREGDVFFCTPVELVALAADPAAEPSAGERERRRRRYEANDAAVVPGICDLDADGEPIPRTESRRGGADGALATGVAVGRGCVVGPARHAREGAHVSVDDVTGAILIVHRPSPVWSRHVLVAAGVVLVGGGPLSHLALLARERGIPVLAAASGDFDAVDSGEEAVLDLASSCLRRPG